MAKRQNGVCQGSIQKIIISSMSKTNTGIGGISGFAATFASSFTSIGGGKRGSSSSSGSSSLSSSTTAANGVNLSTYSLLAGVKLICYENMAAMLNGDHPIAQYSLVGASAVSNDPTSFRAVTDRGTHLLCSVPTRGCRDVWLSALNSGIEFRLLQEQDIPSNTSTNTNTTTTTTGTLFTPVKPKFPRGAKQKSSPPRYCRSCGKIELNRSSESSSYHPAPLSQYGYEERVDLCVKCHMAQGVVEHCDWMEELYSTQQQEQRAMLEARRLVLDKLGQIPSSNPSSPVAGSSKNNNSNVASDFEESASSFGGDNNDYPSGNTIENVYSDKNKFKETEESDEPDRDVTGRFLPKSHTLQLRPLSHHIMGLVFESSQGVALQRLSPTLRSLCTQFQQGMIGVLEFMELLEAAIGIRDPAMAELKKQAFRVAGDMGTALKLLYEQCLPPVATSGSNALDSSRSNHRRQKGNNNHVSTELLQCILEFFLDLVVEENELDTLAFFWPQISNIHLQMLPPKDTLSLQKVELLEDFLLTIASKYSVHLGIELVWSHTADLQDALSGNYIGSTTTYCGQRKSAVIRFLCELESLLFDFDTGWGGGSVTVGQYMSPSNHQIELLKSSIGRIQTYRLTAEHDRLTRSHRLDKLQKLMAPSSSENDIDAISPEILANEAMRIANNADYLTSHLAYTKRLCDIAEKLRFLPVEDRKSALSTELAKLNASGTMGGDLINVIKSNDQGHTRVVRIPITEGHVFRSKARTPVLLLVETVDEIVEEKVVVVVEKKIVMKEDKEENITPKETSNTTQSCTATIGKDVTDTNSLSNQDLAEKTDIAIYTTMNDVEEKEDLSNQEAAEEIGTKETTDSVDKYMQITAIDGEEIEDSSDQEAVEKIATNETIDSIDKSVVPTTASDVEEKDDPTYQDEGKRNSAKEITDSIQHAVYPEIIQALDFKLTKVESATNTEDNTLPSYEGVIETSGEAHGDTEDQVVVQEDYDLKTPIKEKKIKITGTIFEDVVMPELDMITRPARLGSLQSYQSAEASDSFTESLDEKTGIARRKCVTISSNYSLLLARICDFHPF